jgi:hypothetical protein
MGLERQAEPKPVLCSVSSENLSNPSVTYTQMSIPFHSDGGPSISRKQSRGGSGQCRCVCKRVNAARTRKRGKALIYNIVSG